MKKDRHLESKKRLEHILESIVLIEEYAIQETRESFSQNGLVNNAVLFRFSVIGEAINHVEPEILEKYDYPWYKVRSFRNLISHEYFNIKLEAVWQIIQTDMPPLKKMIEGMLTTEFS